MSLRKFGVLVGAVTFCLTSMSPLVASADDMPGLADTIKYINDHTDWQRSGKFSLRYFQSGRLLCIRRQYDDMGGGENLYCAPIANLSMKGLRVAGDSVIIDCSYDPALNGDNCISDENDRPGYSRHVMTSHMYYYCEQPNCLNAFRHLFELLGVAKEPKGDPFAQPH
jgi:hypothetical protein